MQTSVTTADGRAVVRLQGRFDFNSHREFRECVEGVLPLMSVREISVDMAGVDYLDSSALGMLLMLRDKARGTSKEVTLVNCKGAVRQVLDIANFGKLFAIS
ncbi:anti-anti sigma factor HsbA [Denitratisoma sp. agr-D3]